MPAKKKAKEIPLESWAASFKEPVPHRTAKNWAKTNRIPAKIKDAFVEVTVKRRVRKYFIMSDTPLPEFVQ